MTERAEPRSIVAAIRALAKSGLGYEDIGVRLKLTPAEKAFAKQIVLKKQTRTEAA